VRVIWATRHLPHRGVGGGALAEWELIRAVSRTNEIVVVSGGTPPGSAVAELEALGVRCEGVAWSRRHLPPTRLQLVAHLAGGAAPVAVWEVEPCAAALAGAVADLQRRWAADLVQIWPGEMATVAAVAEAPSALLLADCYTRQARRERAAATALRHRLMWSLEARKAERWERRVYRGASAVACVSPVDAEALTALVDRPIDVVPLPVGEEWFAPADVARGEDVVFVGALDYRPNVDAVEHLAAGIWPKVREALPGVRLHIVGSNPVQAVRDAAARCGAEVHANVADVRAWYWSAAVAISPVRLGSGTRNKILHALACQAPLVATAASVEGIGCVHGEDLLVADDAASFATAVVRSLTDRPAAEARAARGALVASRYRAEHAGVVLERFWAAAGRGDRCESSS